MFCMDRNKAFRLVGNDDVAGAVVEDADDGAVGHGVAGQVAHALLGALAVEVAALELGQRGADAFDLADGGQRPDVVVDVFGDVDGDVAAVAFGPSFLPQIAGHFGHFFYFGRQTGAVVEYRFHD